MPKIAFTPFRKSEIVALAEAARNRYGSASIDEVAEQEHIILVREADSRSKKAGFACSLKSETPKKIKSLADPEWYLLSYCEKDISFYNCIVINSFFNAPEREIFWHEYYHLLYSPSRQMKLDFFHHYSTGGVLDAQEERRANIFAAHVLIPMVEGADTPRTMSEKWAVSEELAGFRV